MKETIVKINKTKSGCFWEDVQNWQAFSQAYQEKKKNQINNIRNKKGEVTTDNAEIQRSKSDYYEQEAI